jgi:hypothetical protein
LWIYLRGWLWSDGRRRGIERVGSAGHRG